MQFGLNGTFEMAANCQRMCHFDLSLLIFLKPVDGIYITFGSQGDIGIIHSFSDFDLGMAPSDLELLLGVGWGGVGVGGLQQEDHLASS